MESKHSLIIYIFFTIRKSNVVRRMEEQRTWSWEDTGITEFLVDTLKLRSFFFPVILAKMVASNNYTKFSFFSEPIGMDKSDYMVSE